MLAALKEAANEFEISVLHAKNLVKGGKTWPFQKKLEGRYIIAQGADVNVK